MIGQKLNNRYAITSLIGEGAMGEVYLATDDQTGQQLAVKILSRQLSTRPEALERFRREAETLRQLDHPNIVKFVDAFEHEGQFVIVMEYLPGGSLQDVIKVGPLPIDRAHAITLELCDALTRSHQLNIIHRDIKPDNVLLDQKRTPKLADFGVARLEEGTRMTRTGTQVGTPYYMAPEAWEGKPLDAQADIWSLGVMFFEMLTGKVPFGGDTGAAVMNKVLTAPQPDLKKIREDTPPGLVRIVSRMLTRDKQRRYRTMRQVAVDLENGGQTTNRNPIAMSRNAILIVIGILVLGIITFNLNSFRSIPTLTETPLPAPTIVQTREPDSTSTPLPTQTSIPGGQWIAFNSRQSGNADIYIVDPHGKKLTQLTTSTSHELYPSWSPDGKKITFSSNRSGKYAIYVMGANGENEKKLAAGCVSYFSPDGKQILYGVYCDDTDDLFLMNSDGSKQTALTDGYECKNATWSPDGKSIVFQFSKTTNGGPFQLYIMALDHPQKIDWILLTDYDVNGGSPVWQP